MEKPTGDDLFFSTCGFFTCVLADHELPHVKPAACHYFGQC